ncbi:MAG: hypothetical protein DMG60_15690 [Acidobacteria bacterium]|nr:MAG: hypothetical protein DMG60_15690 [Acidobacteriota bacterium]
MRKKVREERLESRAWASQTERGLHKDAEGARRWEPQLMEQQVRNRRLGHSSRSRRKSVGIKLTFAKAKPCAKLFR